MGVLWIASYSICIVGLVIYFWWPCSKCGFKRNVSINEIWDEKKGPIGGTQKKQSELFKKFFTDKQKVMKEQQDFKDKSGGVVDSLIGMMTKEEKGGECEDQIKQFFE